MPPVRHLPANRNRTAVDRRVPGRGVDRAEQNQARATPATPRRRSTRPTRLHHHHARRATDLGRCRSGALHQQHHGWAERRSHLMNHEQQPQAHPEGTDQTARDLVEMINSSANALAGIRLAALYNEHGPAAIAFAQLPDTDTDADDLRTNFANAYVQTYPDQETFVTSELEGMGWLAEVNQLIARLGIPDGVLMWDRRAIWGALQEMYDIVDYAGQTHVFWA